jgi:hypothetical protein
MSNGLVERTIEKVKRRREHHKVAPSYEMGGGQAQFIFIVFNMFQNINVKDRIRALLRNEIRDYAAPRFTTWQQVTGCNEALEVRDMLGVGIEAKPTSMHSVAQMLGGTA